MVLLRESTSQGGNGSCGGIAMSSSGKGKGGQSADGTQSQQTGSKGLGAAVVMNENRR